MPVVQFPVAKVGPKTSKAKSAVAVVNGVSQRDRALDFHWVVPETAVARCGLVPNESRCHGLVVRSMMAALVMAARDIDATRWVSYSRSKKWYSQPKRYLGVLYTYHRITKAIEELLDAGLIEEERALPGDRGWQSRIRATRKLLDAFADVMFSRQHKPLIRLKDSDGMLLDYDTNNVTDEFQREIEEFNGWLAGVKITLPDCCRPDGPHHVICPTKTGGVTSVRVDPEVVLFRVFNRESWELGGRFYWWGQSLPKAVRKAILLNGVAVAEHDYTATHTMMLYARKGISHSEGYDPYLIDGYGLELREHVKRAVNVMINAETLHEAIYAIMQTLGTTDYAYVEKLCADCKAAHPLIADSFHTGAGLGLMREEADIAAAVMRKCHLAGFAVLPIHDSFVCQEDRIDDLRLIMAEAWSEWAAPYADAVEIMEDRQRNVSSDRIYPHKGPPVSSVPGSFSGWVSPSGSLVHWSDPSDRASGLEILTSFMRSTYGEGWKAVRSEMDRREINSRPLKEVSEWTPTLGELRRGMMNVGKRGVSKPRAVEVVPRVVPFRQSCQDDPLVSSILRAYPGSSCVIQDVPLAA